MDETDRVSPLEPDASASIRVDPAGILAVERRIALSRLDWTSIISYLEAGQEKKRRRRDAVDLI